MSQQSDIYSAPLCEDESIATFTPQHALTEPRSSSFINSVSLEPISSEPSFSQPFPTSTTDSDFVHSLAIPPSLTRIRADRFTEFVLYTNMDKEVFINWWLQTTYGKRPEAKTFNWDRTGHLSDVWRHFDQIASVTDGFPKVKCQRCGRLFDHPGQRKQEPTRWVDI